jgi:signal transduction histidine kinase/CheY-like chemotaxis protein
MRKILDLLTYQPNDDELSISTSRNLISTLIALYLVWHFTATLGWPQIYSPSLWISTITMLVTTFLAFRLLRDYYSLAHIIWLSGLIAAILEMYARYQTPEVLIFLAGLPLITVVTIGPVGTVLMELVIFLLMIYLPALAPFKSVPDAYRLGIALASIFSAFFGWSISSNMLSAIESASFHYHKARELLEETRQHRAEISRMLKERTQVTYQLDRLNQMLQVARTRAEEAQAERDRFVLAISHELRNPLNFIIGFSDLMVNSPETYAVPSDWPPGLFDDIQEIYRSSTHLLGLINDILDMGQVDAQRMSIFREETRLDQIIEEVQEMVGRAFTQKGLYLKVEINDETPLVFVDRTRIRQVLLNLLNNSLRFTESGGVTISLDREDDTAKICVADTGAGIASEDLPKVFDEFRQVGVDNWRRREGSGLGLPISRRFVELHGGKMWLKSQIGEGTRFYFTIPVMESEPEIDPAPNPAPGIFEADAADKLKKLVLLISDNPLANRLARKWLDSYEVITIKNPKQLAKQIRQYLPQAILIDKLIPEDQSVITKGLPYALPVISFYLPSAINQSHQLPTGVSHYLVKPVTRQVLIETVGSLEPSVEKLLVVEDEPAMIRFITQTLKTAQNQNGAGEGLHYQILSASTGQEALELLQTQPIDALLLDLGLPDMVGWDVLEKMRQTPLQKQPHVIVVSAGDLPQVFFTQGQPVLDLTMNRPLSQAELPPVLKSMVETIHPVYPKPADLNSP